MDMLYHRYACPLDLMNNYINRGRFGEFVTSFLEGEHERRKEAFEKDEDLKLWIMYVHCEAEETFFEWKKKVLKVDNRNSKATRDNDLTDEGIKTIIADLFPV